jgi:predicted DNA-binding protein (UPF0251 family)
MSIADPLHCQTEEARIPPEAAALMPELPGDLAADELKLLAKNHGAVNDAWLYRERTVALLRRYMRLSLEVGRLPSLLGREFFRTQVTSYRAHTFEDLVIFVHDIERSLDELTGEHKLMIGMIVLREYSHEEAAKALGCARRTILRSYLEALDSITQIFLKREILTALPGGELNRPKACQGGQL